MLVQPMWGTRVLWWSKRVESDFYTWVLPSTLHTLGYDSLGPTTLVYPCSPSLTFVSLDPIRSRPTFFLFLMFTPFYIFYIHRPPRPGAESRACRQNPDRKVAEKSGPKKKSGIKKNTCRHHLLRPIPTDQGGGSP
jgi:hypothetical protein